MVDLQLEAKKLLAHEILRHKCFHHPRYKVLRKPTSDCQVCKEMWEAKQFLKQFE